MTTKRAPIAAKKKPDYVTEDFVTTVDGTEVRLPSLTYLKPGLVRQIRRLHQIDQMYTLIEMVVDEDTQALLDDMDPMEYKAMLEAWQEHSGVTVGES